MNLGGVKLRALRKERNQTIETAQIWANISSRELSNIERGKIEHPPRKTIEEILNGLSAIKYISAADCNAVLLAFGYREIYPPPSKEEIEMAIRRWKQVFFKVPNPAYLVDCTQQLLEWNRYAPRLLDLSYDDPFTHLFKNISTFDLMFNEVYRAAFRIENRDNILKSIVSVIKHEFQPFINERWCLERIGLAIRTYTELEKLWNDIPDNIFEPYALRAIGPINLKIGNGLILKFQTLGIDFMDDLRFRAVQYFPLDEPTMRQCLQWAEEEKPSQEE